VEQFLTPGDRRRVVIVVPTASMTFKEIRRVQSLATLQQQMLLQFFQLLLHNVDTALGMRLE